jgi:hypothetical protein
MATRPAQAAARQPAFPGRPTLTTFSRRSIVATLAAAFAPSVGTAVALPVIIKAATGIAPAVVAPLMAVPAAESAELLALGAELDTKLEAYRAAAADLKEARAAAAELWPVVPVELVVIEQVDRDRFSDCFEEATDCEGRRVYRPVVGSDGRTYDDAISLYLLRSEPLKAFLADVRDEPDFWEDWVRDDLVERVDAAERYEAACTHAIEASDIGNAKQAAQDRAQDLHSIMFDIREHVPMSIAGVLILARAVAAFDEAQKDSYLGGQRGGGIVLGCELADAVLRIAGVKA